MKNIQKNKPINQFLGVFLVGVMIMFTLIPLVSGLNFDNVKDYDPETKTITITNAFGLGNKIAEIKLNTPQINYVIRGQDRLVAEFTISNEKNYQMVFDKLEFFDTKKSMKKFNREFIYRYKDYETVGGWEVVCDEKLSNDNGLEYIEKYNCRFEEGEQKLKEVWVVFDHKKDLPKGEITIGIFTDVLKGDRVEWIPTFFGVKLDEWAVWEDSLNTNLMHYIPFNETSGTVAENVVNGTANLTTTDGQQVSTGIISYGYNSTEGDAQDSVLNLSGYTNLTVNMWINETGIVPDSVIFTTPLSPSAGGVSMGWYSAGEFSMRVYDSVPFWVITGNIALENGKYHMITLVINDTDIAFYLNGTLWHDASQTNWAGSGQGLRFFEQPNAGSADLGNVILDELAIWNRTLSPTEISNLWNNGVGISYDSALYITINNPDDNLETIGKNVTFNCTGTIEGALTIANVSLFIDGVLNTTVVGGGSTKELFVPLNLSIGSHNFTCNVEDSGGGKKTATTRDITLGFIENSQTYNASSSEFASEDFILNITYDNSIVTSISSNLIYNGTSYLGTKSGMGGNVAFSRTIDIPPITSKTNHSFYWEIIMTDPSGISKFNSTKYNQSIDKVYFAQCNATVNTPLVNFSLFDENTRTSISGNMDATFKYRIGEGSATQNYSINSSVASTSFSFCTNTNQTFIVTSNIEINATSYEDRSFYFNKESYTNVTTNKSLFLLPTGNGTNIIIQLRDSGLVPLENYIIEIKRYYTGLNNYDLVVSKKTDVYGQITAKLIENNVKYKFTFKDENNVVKKTTGDMTIACRTTICVLPFIIEDITNDTERFSNISDYDWSLTFDNSTNVFTFTWNDVSGVSATNWMQVQRILWNGTETLTSGGCNTTSTDASGSLTCAVGSQQANYQVQVFRKIGSGMWRRIAVLSEKVGDLFDTFGKEGVIWSFFFLMTFLAIGFWHPVVGTVLYLGGFILVSFTGIIYVNPAILFAQLVIGVTFCWAFGGKK